jgi:hypothetical protein
MRRRISAVLIASLLSLAPAKADEDRARLGRIMWTAFICSTLGGMSEKKEEPARFFQAGLQAGRDFMQAFQEGKISKEEIDANLPSGVTLLLQGPSIDFIIGRVFSAAENYSYDKVVRAASARPSALGAGLLDSRAGTSHARKSRGDGWFGRNCLHRGGNVSVCAHRVATQ